MDLTTGLSGMNYQTEINVSLLGAERRTLATARVTPPRIGSFGASTTESVELRLDREVNLRLVRTFQIRLRGTRPGNSRVADSWDLEAVALKNGRTPVWQTSGIGVRFNELRTSWESAEWPSYDPAGEKTAATLWEVSTLTGGDDLRADHPMSVIALFDDGTTAGFKLANVPGGSRRVDSLNVPAGTKALDRLVAIALVPSGGLVPNASGLGTGSVYQPTASEDFWDLNDATLRVRLPDGELVQRPLRSLQGRHGFSAMKVSRFKNFDFTIPGTVARSANTPVAIIVFVDGSTGFNRTVGPAFGDLRAAFGMQGRAPLTVVNRVIGRDPSPAPLQFAGWKGFVNNGHSNNHFGVLYQTVRPWRTASGELQSLNLSLNHWETGAPYSGAANLPVKGFMVLQARRDGQPDFNMGTNLSDWTVLSASFSVTESLTARNNSVPFRLTFTRSVRVVRP